MKRFREFREFVGRRVYWLSLASIGVGAFLFLVESSFVFVFQGFARAVNLIDADKVLLPSWYPTALVPALVLFIAFGVLRSVAYLLKSYLGGMVAQAFTLIQRERILRFALPNADRLNSHEVINVYIERVQQSAQLVNVGAQLALTLTTAFLFLVLGLRMAPMEMLMAIGMLGLFLLPLRALNVRVQRAGEGVAAESESASRTLIQGLRHHFFLKIYGLVQKEVDRGLKSVVSYEDHYRKFYLTYSLKNAVPAIAGAVVISAITFVSVRYTHTPSVRLISFFYIFLRLTQSASESTTTFADFRLQMPGLKRLYHWYQKTLVAEGQQGAMLPIDGAASAAFTAKAQSEGIQVEVRGVDFGYDKKAPVLRDFSATTGRGEVLVIQGESGAGKSTLLSLILGMYSPTTGEVLVNTFPVTKVRDALPAFVAYVGPEPYLIPGTVRENLLYGHPHPDEVKNTEIWHALQQAQLRLDIETLPYGIDEMMHEHTQLSTGQRQRLAIARAMLRKPKLLVLDEASANLDGNTEKNFIDALTGLLPELTTIIISHKSSFNAIATQRIELKKLDRSSLTM